MYYADTVHKIVKCYGFKYQCLKNMESHSRESNSDHQNVLNSEKISTLTKTLTSAAIIYMLWKDATRRSKIYSNNGSC